MDGDACGAGCGWCGRCTASRGTVAFACRSCQRPVAIGRDEPYPGPVWCDTCRARAVEREARRMAVVRARVQRQMGAA